MKALLISIVLCPYSLLSQNDTTQHFPSVDFINQPIAWDKTNNATILLEQCKIPSGMHWNVCDSPTSRISLSNIHDLSFLLSSTSGEYMTYLKLYRLNVTKKKRYATSKMVASDQVQLNIKKLSDDVYELVPLLFLEKGEYAFIDINAISYSFRID
ncbi:MAG: hypothetical protein KDB87_05215 [Flavobacteriales bacterium]|nr:hypothetical protein [Caldilineaceae bacterium]MCB0812551.1 hypothetical protein [Flavobacteriales bacterium]